MTGIISQTAAHRIWMAHREIDVGTKLLTDIKEALARREDPTPTDDFGRRRSYTLGVPTMANDGQRLLDVSPRLAAAVIEAHLVDKRRELIEATLAAKIEMETVA